MNECYRNLAAAILLKAIEDYKNVLYGLKSQRITGEEVFHDKTKKQRELEDFFDSSWCDTLYNGDGTEIRHRIYRKIMYNG